jgi:cytochrome c556
MRNFGLAARAFQAAAAGGDLAAMRAAHGRLGQTCGACHEPYRAKDD